MIPVARFAGIAWLLLSQLSCPFLNAATDDPVRLSREHADIRILYAPGTIHELYLVARDGDSVTNYASTHVVLVVSEPAKTVLPEGFEVFGEAGAPFWILPASQDPELLFLGVSAEGLPRGVFEEPMAIRLESVRAPGHFFVWQFDPGGALEMRMNSRDGLGPEDRIEMIPGSHGHYYWGFTTNGVYEVTFRVEGRLRGAATNLTAVATPFRFLVEPLPPDPPTPATLSDVAVAGGQMICRVHGTSGTRYLVQTSPDLVSWTDGPQVAGAAGGVEVTIPLPSDEGTLFVRALSP